MNNEKITGSEALLKSLLSEGVNTLFGYPGGAIMPVYDALYGYRKTLKHILARHEQGAVHAAQGYARASGEVGVALVTSGPGATNAITGIADAMIDSTPLVVICGQVLSGLLGSDAFQEVDVVGISQPVSKWSIQVRKPEDIAPAIAKGFFIARSGRPGPVVIDITKDAQLALVDFQYKPCTFIRSYIPYPALNEHKVHEAAKLINNAQKPYALIGQGVELGKAEKELLAFVEKAGIPCAWTLLGAAVMPSGHPLNKGMLGMHGSLGPNVKTNECDVLIAIGMRFDDRVTGDLKTYAKQAKIIHLDIDPSEINKNVKVDVAILADVKQSLPALTALVNENKHTEWCAEFDVCMALEAEKVINAEVYPTTGELTMGEVVHAIAEKTQHQAIVVTDVGQNQMMAARYSKYSQSRSLITSGGLGTMGFGLPAAMGAKMGAPDRVVCMFVGDGGMQMTIQELGTIMQNKIDVKIIVLNNKYLGMVRQWQELFHGERYSETPMLNPDFVAVAKAYRIEGSLVKHREDLSAAIDAMLAHNGPYLLEVEVEKKGMVYPMMPAGSCVTNVILGRS